MTLEQVCANVSMVSATILIAIIAGGFAVAVVCFIKDIFKK